MAIHDGHVRSDDESFRHGIGLVVVFRRWRRTGVPAGQRSPDEQRDAWSGRLSRSRPIHECLKESLVVFVCDDAAIDLALFDEFDETLAAFAFCEQSRDAVNRNGLLDP